MFSCSLIAYDMLQVNLCIMFMTAAQISALTLTLLLVISQCTLILLQKTSLCNNLISLLWQKAHPWSLTSVIQPHSNLILFPLLLLSVCGCSVSPRHADSGWRWPVVPSARSTQLPTAVQRVCRKHQQQELVLRHWWFCPGAKHLHWQLWVSHSCLLNCKYVLSSALLCFFFSTRTTCHITLFL